MNNFLKKYSISEDQFLGKEEISGSLDLSSLTWQNLQKVLMETLISVIILGFVNCYHNRDVVDCRVVPSGFFTAKLPCLFAP